MASVTVSDVESLENKGWQSLDASKKSDLLADAEQEYKDLYSGRLARNSVNRTTEDLLVKYLAAHKFELAEGGEAQSESQTGGNTSYNVANPETYLELTRYGQTVLDYLNQRQQVSIVRSF